MLAGLDPNYRHFGFNSRAFLSHFESSEFPDRRCTMIRKGVSISAIQRKGPQSIVISPYGINENMVDLYNIIPLTNSTSYTGNNFKANIKLVEDNTLYWKKLMRKFNFYVIRKINIHIGTIFGFRLEELTNEMMLVSIFKYLFGNNHESHSYLLE